MTKPDEDDDAETYPDTLGSESGDVHFGIDAQNFLVHWLRKLDLDAEGGALLIGEGPSILIVHPETGEVLSPAQIAKQAATRKVRSVQ